ncbi:hypothetical protein F2P81_008945 [Scophthalmus maximus]|uniref:Uncharacterized protein n=1 Tax=Scophthalmus maximus TaxID=52904 RepID=A0A6A4T5R8_SCOMX|nr:hypothetical protein F2P81_008945 [Scophthalmus maximus]
MLSRLKKSTPDIVSFSHLSRSFVLKIGLRNCDYIEITECLPDERFKKHSKTLRKQSSVCVSGPVTPTRTGPKLVYNTDKTNSRKDQVCTRLPKDTHAEVMSPERASLGPPRALLTSYRTRTGNLSPVWLSAASVVPTAVKDANENGRLADRQTLAAGVHNFDSSLGRGMDGAP